MKTSPCILTRSIATLLAALALHNSNDAATGTWGIDNSGNWSATGSWAGGTIADGIDSTANFRFNITANRTVTLDTAGRIIGNLVFEDLTTASHDWTLAGSNTLTLDVSAGTSGITVTNRTATISTVLAGNDGVTTAGAGTLVLAGANTFTGGLIISGGTIVQINNNNGAGASTNPISFATGATGRLQVNGGRTIANPINIGAGITNATGRGVIEQTGTGQATVNGAINITASPTNGGHFFGGSTAGNELVLGGAITSSVTLTQRDGRVVYKGGGSYTGLSVTGTAIVGADNGISATAAVTLGSIAPSATLDLGSFNQTVAGLTYSNVSTGAVTGTTGVLTLGGNVSSSGNFTHVLNGNVDLGAATRSFTVADGTNAVDFQAGAAFSNGTLNKLGAGTMTLDGTSSAAVTLSAGALALNGTSNGTVTVSAGTLALNGTSNAAVTLNGGALNGTGTVNATLSSNAGTSITPATAVTAGTLTASSLTFGAGATTVNMNVGATSDLISVTGANGLTASTTTINIAPNGAPIANGTYNLIGYSGAIQGSGFGGFTLGTLPGRTQATLVDNPGAVALSVTGNDSVIWTGATNGTWDINTTQNWKLQSDSTATGYLEGDDLIFDDSGANTAIALGVSVNPARATFANTTAVPYTVSGAGGLNGTMSLNKTGNGTVLLRTANGYIGATTVGAGTLEIDHDGGALTGTSGVAVTSGATLKLTRDNADFTFDRAISGAGTVVVDANTGGTAGARTATITGNNSGFTGLLKLSPTAGGGSLRTSQLTSQNAGSGSIDVDSGAQLWVAANQTLSNPIEISGIGFLEAGGGTPNAGAGLGASGGIGAIRLDGGAVLSGPITLNGNAKVMAFNATATISGNIGSVNATDMLVVSGGTGTTSDTIILTGTNSYGPTWVNSGSGATAVTHTLQIGNNGTTGTLGTGAVTLLGEASAVSVLRFDRTDGYTLGAGNTISSSGTTASTRLDIDVRGTGFSQNGQAINLGTGGAFRVGTTRASAIANINGVLTSGSITIGVLNTGASTANATLNIGPGAVVNSTGNVTMAAGGSTTPLGNTNGATMNISGGSLTVTGSMFQGDQNSSGANVTQTGGDVIFGNTGGQMRIAHWPANTSNYSISAGTLTVNSAPTAFPFQTVSPQETNGGIYLGVDGTGNLTQTGGTVSTSFIMLDNRADVAGIDTYALSGGTLVLKHAHGIISRFATTAVNLTGGTIRAATGISPNLDSNRITLGGPVTFDTNGAASTFTLYAPFLGAGTAQLTGGGTFRTQDGTGATLTAAGGGMPGGSLAGVAVDIAAGTTLQANRTGTDTWTGVMTGAGILSKANTGTLNYTGNGSGFTGTANVTAGRLNLPANFGAPTINVSDAASLGGEPTTTTLTLGTTTGANLFIDAVTAGALTAANATFNGTTTVDFSRAATAGGTVTVLNYTNKTGTPTFALANAANYRAGTAFNDTGSSITLDLVTKNLTWTGATNATWDTNATTNWTDGAVAEKFYALDTVTFGDSGANPAITITGTVLPGQVNVSSSTVNYSFAGGAIGGTASLVKSGASTLTLSAANTYSGSTSINGGTVSIAAATALGDASPTNTISLDGGKLTSTATMDLGANRAISIGAGGGTLSSGGTAGAYTITIPGALSGTGTLTFTSGNTTAPTFVLSGNNSGFSGNVNVNGTGATTGGTTLRLTNSNALTAGTVTVAAGATAGAGGAIALDLQGVTIGSGVTASLNTATGDFRSTLSSTTTASVWNGPVILNGGSLAQITANAALTLNGNTTAGGGGFTGTMFLRGGSTGIINGTINLPNGSVSKTDGGTWTITSTGNVWGNTSTAAAGSLKIGANNVLPITTTLNIGQSTDASNSLFDLSGFNQEVAGITYTAGTANSTRGITNTSGTLSTLTVNNSANFSFGASTGVTGGILQGNLRLVKSGAGILTLGGSNTLTGGIAVNAGTLRLGGATSPLGPAATTVTVADGATIDAQTFVPTTKIANLTIQGAGVGGLGALIGTTAGTVNAGFANLIDFTGGDLTVSTTVRYDFFGAGTTVVSGGTRTLTKLGAGETWWSPAPGAAVGQIVVNAGVFGVQLSNNLGDNSFPITINAGGSVYGYGPAGLTNTKPVNINGGVLAANNGTNTWTGSITLSGAGVTNRIGTVGTGTNVTVNGKVTGAGGFEKIGAGAVTLGAGDNDYTGDTRVTAGALTVGASGVLSPASTLEMNGGTVNLAATAQTAAGLKGVSGTIQGGGALTVNQAADTTFGGAIASTTALTKDGPGALTLSGVNTTTGPTTINAGTLLVTGSLAGATTVSGGTLGGTGGVGALLVASGTLAPGLSPGILDAGNTTFGGGIFALEISGPTVDTEYDQLNVTGTVTLTADTPITIDLGAFDPEDFVQSFTIVENDLADAVDTTGGLFSYGGNPLSQGEGFTVGTQVFEITYTGGDGNDVVLVAVPEPGAFVSLLGGLGLLAGLRRFRRRA